MTQPMESGTHDACPRCGLEPGVICDGYLAPADLDLLLEEVPPPVLRALAQAARDHMAGKFNESLVLLLDCSKGGHREWTIKRALSERVEARKRA